MQGHIRWENNARTVVQVTFAGQWNWDDFYGVLDQREPCTAGHAAMCALIDLRAVRGIPSNAVQQLGPAAHLAEATSGLIIVIATSVSAATMFRLFVTIYRSLADRFRLVDSDEAARAILQTQ